jgi:DNA-binding transcriptional LysR family regulator
MNINQLKYFLVLAETGSFTKASERLFITQPSLSVGIQKLEEYFGVRLFERGKKHIALTYAGKYFLYKAKNILNEFELVKKEMRHICDSHNILRIGTLDTISVFHIAKLTSSFSNFYPNIVIEQLRGNIVELQNGLERGNIDLAITILKNKEDRRTSQLLFQENYSVAVAESHYLTERKSLSFSELDGLPYIDRVKCEKREELQKLFIARGICPKIIYRSTHEEFTNALVATGIGIAVMPDRNSIPGIVHLPFSDLNLTRQVGLVWRSEENLKTVGLFHKFSTSYFTEDSLVSPFSKIRFTVTRE